MSENVYNAGPFRNRSYLQYRHVQYSGAQLPLWLVCPFSTFSPPCPTHLCCLPPSGQSPDTDHISNSLSIGKLLNGHSQPPHQHPPPQVEVVQTAKERPAATKRCCDGSYLRRLVTAAAARGTVCVQESRLIIIGVWEKEQVLQHMNGVACSKFFSVTNIYKYICTYIYIHTRSGQNGRMEVLFNVFIV